MKITVLLLAFLLSAAGRPQEESPEFDRLLEQIRSDDPETRMEASEGLAEILAVGGGNRAACRKLRKAFDAEEDPEVKIRIGNLLQPWSRGGVVWSRDLEVPIDSIVACGEERVVLITRHKVQPRCYPCELRLVAVSPASGKTLWEAPDPIGMNPAKGRVVGGRFVCRNGVSVLMAYDLRTGKREWSAKSRWSFSDPVFRGKTVFLGGFNWAYAYDVETGAERWVRKGDRWMIPPILVGDDLITGGVGGILCLSQKDGAEKWRVDGRGTPVTLAGDLLLCNSGGTLSALRVSDGSEVWTWKAPKDANIGGISASEGRVAARTSRSKIPDNPRKSSLDYYDFRLHLLDGKTGELQWSVKQEAGEGAPVVSGKFVRAAKTWYRVSDGEPRKPLPAERAPRFAAVGLSFEHDPPQLGEAGAATVLRAARLRDLDADE